MALGTAAWFALVKLLPPRSRPSSSIAIPIVAVVSGVIILHEPLSSLQAIAIGSTVSRCGSPWCRAGGWIKLA